jgi:hypothetical protein
VGPAQDRRTWASNFSLYRKRASSTLFLIQFRLFFGLGADQPKIGGLLDLCDADQRLLFGKVERRKEPLAPEPSFSGQRPAAL